MKKETGKKTIYGASLLTKRYMPKDIIVRDEKDDRSDLNLDLGGQRWSCYPSHWGTKCKSLFVAVCAGI